MAEYRERSGLFKFFYIILRVITFPLFVVIYVLKHPIWVLFLLFLAFCLVIYYPLVDGAELADVPEWYKNKYTQVRRDVVKKAAESDNLGIISQSLQDELKEEAKEDSRPKSENYNKKIIREDKIEEKTSDLKKRGGFKKRNSARINDAVVENKEEVLKQSEGAVGGLADVLKNYQAKEVTVDKEEKQPSVDISANKETNAEIEKPVLPENMTGLLPVVTTESKNEDPAQDKESVDEFDLF